MQLRLPGIKLKSEQVPDEPAAARMSEINDAEKDLVQSGMMGRRTHLAAQLS